MSAPFVDPDDVVRRLDAVDHLVDEGTATALFLAATLGQPLLLEGEPGVGKTAAAKAMASALGAPLIRLQCYEGLAVNEALYEWNYQRQLLAIRLAEAQGRSLVDADLFTEEFLLERPILACLRHQGPVRAGAAHRRDRPGRRRVRGAAASSSSARGRSPSRSWARSPRCTRPIVVLTSNRSRELHDALKRRCLYHWIDFPERGPGGRDRAAVGARRRATRSCRRPPRSSVRVRELDLDKAPGLAEAINWVSALSALGVTELGRARRRPHPRRRRQDPRRPRPRRRLARRASAVEEAAGRPTLFAGVDRAALAAALGRRLRTGGVPVTLTGIEGVHAGAVASAHPTDAAASTGSPAPPSCSDQHDLAAFDAVFAAIFDDADIVSESLVRRSPAAGRDDDQLVSVADRP